VEIGKIARNLMVVEAIDWVAEFVTSSVLLSVFEGVPQFEVGLAKMILRAFVGAMDRLAETEHIWAVRGAISEATQAMLDECEFDDDREALELVGKIREIVLP
jgi:hypothetical protein